MYGCLEIILEKDELNFIEINDNDCWEVANINDLKERRKKNTNGYKGRWGEKYKKREKEE